MILRPQSGKQEVFLSTTADIALYGGQAGSGKSFSLLLESLRELENPKFTCLILRRNMTDIKKPGALWDEASSIYPLLDGKPNKQEMTWKFPSGAKVQFGHLENESTIYSYQGSQIALLGWDELTHFSKDQFFYMLSRNRSNCGVKPYVRCTTNPDKDSWVRKFIDWYIDPTTGYAIEERSGVLRYFIRHDDEIIWADSVEEIVEFGLKNNIKSIIKDGSKVIKSFTFIPASLADNKILTDNDPSYLANLEAQNKVEKERLLFGNWNISYNDIGSLLNRHDFSRYDYKVDHKGEQIFPMFEKTYFVVDAAAKTKEANDYSVIGYFGKCRFDQNYYIIDWYRGKLEACDLEQQIIDMWQKWKMKFSPQGIWIEDASIGPVLINNIKKKGIPVFPLVPIKDKFMRLNDILGIIKSKFVYVPYEASWINKFITECESFRADSKHVIMDGEVLPHDDQVDVLSYALGNQITVQSIVYSVKPREKKKKNVRNWMNG